MKDFKKYYSVNATPEEIYLALTTASTLHLWTGAAAEMEPVVDSEFSLWDGAIVGRNLEFEKDKRIVQQWYFGDQQEPSVVTLKFHPAAGGTSVELRHTNIPDEAYNDIVDGWNNVYFASLIDFYGP
jgi:activator of HSP90 ATPase